MIGISIPIFFLGLVLKFVFSVQLGWLPSVGRYDLREYADIPTITNLRTVDCLLAASPGCFGDAVSHLILPAITLGSIPLAIIARITRSSVVEVLNEDYVRTAHAKGLGARTIDRRHVLRNAMIPIATVIGLQAGLLLSGAIPTERVFAWGGIGTWLYSGLSAKDYPVILAGILFLAILFVLVNLAVDVWYAFLNPRFATRAERMTEASRADASRALELDALRPSRGLWGDAWRRFFRTPSAVIGLVMVSIFVLVAIFAPFLAPYDPSDANLSESPAPPSAEHPLGQDLQGRDELSRIIYGGAQLTTDRNHLGDDRREHRPDHRCHRGLHGRLGRLGADARDGHDACDPWPAFRHRHCGRAGSRSVSGHDRHRDRQHSDLRTPVTGIDPAPSRRATTRSRLAPSAHRDHASWAATSCLTRSTPLIVAATLAVATAVIDAAGLGFLGLGPQDPRTAEWGTMLADAPLYLAAPRILAIFPGLAIVLSVLGFNLLGDGLRESLDPRLRR